MSTTPDPPTKVSQQVRQTFSEFEEAVLRYGDRCWLLGFAAGAVIGAILLLITTP